MDGNAFQRPKKMKTIPKPPGPGREPGEAGTLLARLAVSGLTGMNRTGQEDEDTGLEKRYRPGDMPAEADPFEDTPSTVSDSLMEPEDGTPSLDRGLTRPLTRPRTDHLTGIETGTGVGTDAQTQSRLSLQPLSEKDREAVVAHLLFHKSILDDEDDGERLNRYMRLVDDLGRGFFLTVKDPYDRSISMAFELTMHHHLDPWDIDLARFSGAYMSRMRDEKDVDLITAGRIIFMAWSVLKLQSDDVLYRAEHDAEEEEEEVLLSDPEGDWYTDEASYEFTHQMIQRRTPSPIREMVWRKGKRPVTLLELVSAFEEAKKEAEIQKELSERRRELRRQNLIMRRALVGNNYHKEDLEAEKMVVWARINEHNGHPIPLSLITTGDLEDRITTIISTLHLAKERKVSLWQKRFPYGEIYIKNLMPGNYDAGPLVAGKFGTARADDGTGGSGGGDGGGNGGGNGGDGGNGGTGGTGGDGGDGGDEGADAPAGPGDDPAGAAG